ncbi:MAG: GAF domain-containing protein [Anaerolineae bacterium]
MVNKISRIQNRMALLFGTAAVIATLLLVFVLPIVSDLSPLAARRARTSTAALGATALVAGIVLLRLYLRPISDLSYALEIGSAPAQEIARDARRIALNAPVYIFVLSTGGVLIVSFLYNLIGTFFLVDHVFSVHVVLMLLSTAVAACSSLIAALGSRHLLQPVLLYTSGRANTRGIRVSIRTRVLAATLSVVLLAVLLPGAYGITRVVEEERAQAGERMQWQLTHALSELPADTSIDQSLAQIAAQLGGGVAYDHLFVLDEDGQVLAQQAKSGVSLSFERRTWLPDRPAQVCLGNTCFTLVPSEVAGTRRWFAVGYTVGPLGSRQVGAMAAAVGLSGTLSIGLALALGWLLSRDLVSELDDVADRLDEAAHRDRLSLSSPLPILACDEVGDLVVAQNALQRQIRLQQEQAEHRQRQLAALQSLTYRIGTTHDIDHLLQQVIRDVERAFGYHNVSLLLTGKEGEELYFAATELLDASLRQRRFRVGMDGVVGHAAATGEPLLINDVSTCEFYIPDGTNTRSELAVPLTLNNKVVGVLNVSSERTGAFEESDLQIVTAVANQVAIAIENARLLGRNEANDVELEEQKRKLDLLRDLSLSISTALRRQDLLDTVVQQLVPLIRVEYCAILWIEQDENTVRVVAAHPSQSILGQQMSLRQVPAVQRILAAPQTRQFADVQHAEPLGSLRELLADVGAGSMLLVPATAKGRVKGAILLSTPEVARTFTEDERSICEMVAAQVGIAVQNVQLVEDTRAPDLSLVQEASKKAPSGAHSQQAQSQQTRPKYAQD